MIPTIQRTPAIRRRGDLGFDFDRLFDSLLDTRVSNQALAATDLYETEDGYALELEVPGFSEEEIDVTVDRGVLTISGARETDEEHEGRTYHVRERTNERFTRSFSLPASVRGNDVEAQLASGVLAVRLPKSPEAKPRRIEVFNKSK